MDPNDLLDELELFEIKSRLQKLGVSINSDMTDEERADAIKTCNDAEEIIKHRVMEGYTLQNILSDLDRKDGRRPSPETVAAKKNMNDYKDITEEWKSLLAAAKGFHHFDSGWESKLVRWNNVTVDLTSPNNKYEGPEDQTYFDNYGQWIPPTYNPDSRYGGGGYRRTRKHMKHSKHNSKHKKHVARSRSIGSIRRKNGTISTQKYKPTHTRKRRYNKSRTYKY